MKFDTEVTREKMTRPPTRMKRYDRNDYRFARKRTKRTKKVKAVVHAHDVERDQDSY